MDDNLGHSVSLSADGNVIAIGAPWNGIAAGHVRIYKNVNSTWTQVGSDIEGEAAYDFSGNSVSLSADGNVVAVGALSFSYNYSDGTPLGNVRIYKNINNTWIKIGDDIKEKLPMIVQVHLSVFLYRVLLSQLAPL